MSAFVALTLAIQLYSAFVSIDQFMLINVRLYAPHMTKNKISQHISWGIN